LPQHNVLYVVVTPVLKPDRKSLSLVYDSHRNEAYERALLCGSSRLTKLLERRYELPMTRARIKPKRDPATVLSPAIRQRKVEERLRRFLKLLKQAKRPTITKACIDAGTTIPTFRRYRKLFEQGGADAVRKALENRGESMFQLDPRTVPNVR
jgi:hypothetical protein